MTPSTKASIHEVCRRTNKIVQYIVIGSGIILAAIDTAKMVDHSLKPSLTNFVNAAIIIGAAALGAKKITSALRRRRNAGQPSLC